MDGLPVAVERMASFADFSAEGVLAPMAPIACSNGFAGVLGVLAEPNDANAPEPRPNWFAPPVLVGEAKAAGVVGAKGPVRPWEEVAPFLRDRLEKSRGVVLSVEPVVPRERLLVLVLLRRVHIDSLSMVAACCSQPVDEQDWRLRNLGKPRGFSWARAMRQNRLYLDCT